MNYMKAKETINKMMMKYSFLQYVCIGLVFTQIIMATSLIWIASHPKTYLVPPLVDKKITLESNAVDGSYLREMALFFLNTRLNVTPETIETQNKILLQYTAPEYYAEFLKELNHEKERIESDKITSVFYPSEIRINPATLVADITGNLNTSVGTLKVTGLPKHYRIQFEYNSTNLKIKSLSEIGGKNA